MNAKGNRVGTIITISSQKGGVGKTTVALNLAVALAERQRSVALVDIDPQGGIGLALARGDTALSGLAEVLAGAASLEQALMKTKLEKLTLLPRGKLDPIDVVAFEQALTTRWPQLAAALKPAFDVVLIDTPAGLGMPTRAALQVSDWALLLVQAEPLALRSVQQGLRVIEHVRGKENPKLKLLGLLLTMVELKKDASREVAETMWKGFSGVLDTLIPRADVFLGASHRGLPLAFLGGPPNPEARRFELLAAELEELIARQEGGSGVIEQAERQLL